MAGRFSRKRVFPVLLENAAQTIDAAGTKDWNKDTSSVKIDVDGNVTLNLAKPLENGTLVIVEITQASFTSSNSVDIKDTENSTTVVSLNGTNESATLMWNAEEWKLIANESASGTVTGVNGSFSGTLAVTGAATLSDALTVTGATTLNGSVTVDQPISFDSATASELTNRATGVTINEPAGIATTFTASLATDTEAVLTVSNTYVDAGDIIIVTPLTNGEELSYFHVENVVEDAFDIAYAQGTGSPAPMLTDSNSLLSRQHNRNVNGRGKGFRSFTLNLIP